MTRALILDQPTDHPALVGGFKLQQLSEVTTPDIVQLIVNK